MIIVLYLNGNLAEVILFISADHIILDTLTIRVCLANG
ncbi:MAG: hypothetical protein OFPII_24760 [Osedax symbiont Rs1]|nr:MAG: hypothetical protein OFPII_24760 [Osedax symbiont Rs1]